MATSTTDPTICTCPSLFCTNVCMYKSLNKNCATFLIKKKEKKHLYFILSCFELYL